MMLAKRYKKYQYGSNMNDADEALQTGVNSAIQAGANAIVPGAGAVMQAGAGLVDAVAPPDKYGEQNKAASLIKGSFSGGTIGMIMAASSWKKQHERAMRLKDQESLNNNRIAERQTAARVSSDPTAVSGNTGTLMNGYYAAGGQLRNDPIYHPNGDLIGSMNNGKFIKSPSTLGLKPETTKWLSDDTGVDAYLGKKYGQSYQGRGTYTPAEVAPSKIDYSQFTPDKTITSRVPVYNNDKQIVYQDTYGNNRQDVTYQDKKTGRLNATPWHVTNDRQVNYNATGSLNLTKPPTASVIKLATGGSMNVANQQIQGGTATPLNNSAAQFNGPSHEEGGIQIPGKSAEVEGKETTNGDYVFSEQLGFAKLHKPIAKAIGIIEKKTLSPERVTSIQYLKGRENNLKLSQEYVKQMYGLN